MKKVTNGLAKLKASGYTNLKCASNRFLREAWVKERDAGMKGKKILVSGASGTVGCALATTLAKDNEVHGLARFIDEDLARALEEKGIVLHRRDVTKENPLDGIPSDFDNVFFETVKWDAKDGKEQQDMFKINTYLVGKLMLRCKNSRFVLGSTGGVYVPGDILHREETVLTANSPYEVTKVSMEALATFLSQLHDIPACIVRYFWPYAPYGPAGGPVRPVALRIRSGRHGIAIAREGGNKVCPTFITDVVELTIRAAEHCSVPPLVINLRGPDTPTIQECAEAVAKHSNVKLEVKMVDRVRNSLLGDDTRLNKKLGGGKVHLDEGARRVVEDIHMTPADYVRERV